MDPLDKLTIRTVELATYTRNAFHADCPDLVYEHLGELYDLLDEEFCPKAQHKCEPDESPSCQHPKGCVYKETGSCGLEKSSKPS